MSAMNPNTGKDPLHSALRDIADEERLAYNWSRIEARRRFETGRRFITFGFRGFAPLAAVSIALVAVPVVIVLGLRWHAQKTDHEPQPLTLAETAIIPVMANPAWATEQKQVTLSDGSQLFIAPGASLEVLKNSGTEFKTVLRNGWVRFNVEPGKKHTWTIDGGLADIVVVGTAFTASRTQDTLRVSVHRGTVHVKPLPFKGDLIELTAGESRTLTRPKENKPLVASLSDPYATCSGQGSGLAVPKIPSQAFSAFSLKLEHDLKLEDSVFEGVSSKSPVNAMLKEADDARKHKDNKRAASILEKILRDFPNDPAFGLAALTLGKIQLNALNRPKEAAWAFERAASQRTLASPLREQAYAKCVEALHRGGRDNAAKKMRDAYKQQFPNGDWLPWIEQWVGTE